MDKHPVFDGHFDDWSPLWRPVGMAANGNEELRVLRNWSGGEWPVKQPVLITMSRAGRVFRHYRRVNQITRGITAERRNLWWRLLP